MKPHLGKVNGFWVCQVRSEGRITLTRGGLTPKAAYDLAVSDLRRFCPRSAGVGRARQAATLASSLAREEWSFGCNSLVDLPVLPGGDTEERTQHKPGTLRDTGDGYAGKRKDEVN